MRARWRRPSGCRDTLAVLQAYLDGEADVDDAWRVARHLSACEDCFGDAETLRVLRQAVSRLRVAPDARALARLRGIVRALEEHDG